MADFEKIAAEYVKPLSQTATNVVKNAFALTLAAGDDYVESSVALESLDFVSSAVGGLAAAATAPAPGGARSSATVTVPLSDSAGGSDSVPLTLTLYGPGDVRGIDGAQIIRRHPAPGANGVEESLLAHVEFDRPELPWAFSAEAPGARMRPWLALVVVDEAAVLWEPASQSLLPVVQLPLDQLPALDNAKLWAHAQVPRSTTGTDPSLTARLSPAYAPVNLSRLVSPRILSENTSYTALLVPTTEAGVHGGLGLGGGTLQPAWAPGSSDPVRLPVYDSWSFRTGPDGDFRSLAIRLNGIVAPYEVGRQFIDATRPGKPLRALADTESGGKQVLRCALYSPTPAPPDRQEAETAAWPGAMTDELRAELDLPAAIEGAGPRTGGVPDLPIIGPRIYGKLHRGSAVIEGTDWFADLNLSPTRRIVGGLGTRVVQRDQEQLMQAAWAQLGEVEKANAAIRLAQLAELLAARLHARLAGLTTGRLLQVAGPLTARVSVTAGSTVAAQILSSATPITVATGAFRRSARPAGPIARRADAASRARIGALVGGDGALRDFTRVYSNPEGIGALATETIAALDMTAVSQALGVAPDGVAKTLGAASARVEKFGGIASYLTEPAKWKAAVDFAPAEQLASDWSEKLLRTGDDPAIAAIRAQRTGPLVAELALSKTTAASPLRERLQGSAVTLNDQVLDQFGVIGKPEGPVVVKPDGPVIRPDGPVIRPDGPVVVKPGKPIVKPDGPVVIRPVTPLGPVIRGLQTPAAPILRSPIGGVGRLPGGIGTRVQGDVIGRIPIGGGLRKIDVQKLDRLGGTSDVAVLDAGLKQFADLAEVKLTPTLDRVDQLPVDVLRAEMASIIDPGELLTIAPVPHRDALAVTAAALTTALDPHATIRSALAGRISLPASLAGRWAAQPRITPIMAAPRFDRPMFRAIEEFDRDWLVPGLGQMPADDFVTVLSTNSEFMAAFFVGLSDEMGRELLWRGYPTDQRGTYFHRFWNPDKDELAGPIHAFPHTPLASHITLGDGDGRAVIVVKSELVRRFPDLVIEAVKSQGGTPTAPVFETDTSPQQSAELLFAEGLDPDIALVGVDLSIDELQGDDWWILIAEHPSATRFEIKGHPTGANLADAAADASAWANTHLRKPIRVAFKASTLIAKGA